MQRPRRCKRCSAIYRGALALAGAAGVRAFAQRHLPPSLSTCAWSQRCCRGRAVQLLLGHSKLESTVPYLGIEVDDVLEISEQTEI